MDKKYLIIDKNGKEYKIKDYLKHNKDKKLEIFIRCESGERIMNKKISNYNKIAEKFGFSWEKNSSVGFVNYDYKANFIMRMVKEYARQLNNEIGIPLYEVRGANAFDMNYPVVKAYAKLFGDRLFYLNIGKNKFVQSYDASYPQFNLASNMKFN